MVKKVSKIALQVSCQNGESLQKTGRLSSAGRAAFEWDTVSAVIELSSVQASKIGSLDLDFSKDSTAGGLAMDYPVRVSIHMSELPEAITAFSMVNDWWTRPAFAADYGRIPKRTQVALLKYANRFECLVPMVGTVFKSILMPGGPDWFTLTMTAGLEGATSVHEPMFICSEGATVREAVETAFSFLARERGVPMRTQRRYPETFEYLGWCSWDAFYRDLTEEGVRAKAEEFQEKNVPVRWFLLDDGWLTTKDEMLWDFIPDAEKFPGGFSSLTQELRLKHDIRWFGVWHALAGYWKGIHPEGPLAVTQSDHLQQGRENLLPKAKTEDAFGFYSDWHRFLLREGIDFVKVDVQGDIANQYRGLNSVCQAADALQSGLDAGSACMDNTVINCMGMNLENMLSRPVTAISRNSDDFFPRKPASFKEHLLENAYNALYHGQLYWSDWDMFWTSHPDAVKHAVLRALSGGPVYVSDPLGETSAEVLPLLAYEDGRVLRLSRPALPTADCVFRDPFKEGILKLQNMGGYSQLGAGALAAFNLTENRQTDCFVPRDIESLPEAEGYIIYDWAEKTVRVAGSEEPISMEIDPDEWRLYWVLPRMHEGAILGLTDKLVGFTALENCTSSSNGMIATLREGGAVGVVTPGPIRKAMCNGVDVNLNCGTQKTISDSLIFSAILLPSEANPAILELEWR